MFNLTKTDLRSIVSVSSTCCGHISLKNTEGRGLTSVFSQSCSSHGR
ncbi:unnamed protein product [Chondrus crispus]|uniref:Uncharacterized protein n=1 Tax=Chondrus crispus TaxID=2769 RepID=R7QDV3_CHOCR|nr:unnamed protein product [Chondrus crispus]CDF35938.1 unnamed protein product [Chondrus crispus]|eukprot:XP_005715757.1 unnamed protein product [Chondrus crispus]